MAIMACSHLKPRGCDLYSSERLFWSVSDLSRVAACGIREDSSEIIQNRFTSGKLPQRLEVFIWMDEHK